MKKIYLITLILTVFLFGCSKETTTPQQTKEEPNKELIGIKTFLLNKTTDLKTSTAKIKQLSDDYYNIAKSHNFDYQKMWKQDQQKICTLITEAKKQYLFANSSYELEEGIVAGVPSLVQYDVNIDAGIAASEGQEDVVTFDITLPNGQVLKKPGNYFLLAEASLWGTKTDWISNVQSDIDNNGKVEFGEVLPEANRWKGTMDGFAAMSADLWDKANAWQPTKSDAFTALVVMIPTMDEYFQAWKESRSVSGENAKLTAFVAVSRLSDIVDILTGLEEIYRNVEPMIAKTDQAQATQTKTELANLKGYVENIYKQEKSGKHFQSEEADMLGSEAQKRATAIAGQITQSAAKLKIELKD
jgi:hypothetical protein